MLSITTFFSSDGKLFTKINFILLMSKNIFYFKIRKFTPILGTIIRIIFQLIRKLINNYTYNVNITNCAIHFTSEQNPIFFCHMSRTSIGAGLVSF